MPTINNDRGVSLLELIIATVLLTSVVVTLSLTLPKASAHIIQNRQRAIASNLASAQIESLKSQPYDLVDRTDENKTIVPLNALLCDCTKLADFSVLPSTSTDVAGTIFTTASCINSVKRIGTTWPAQCSTALPSDTGWKNILVRVWWTAGGNTYSTTQESMMTRT